MEDTGEGLPFDDDDPNQAALFDVKAAMRLALLELKCRPYTQFTLTDDFVRRAQCGTKESWLEDREFRGLALRLRPSGAKTFYFLSSSREGAGSARHRIGSALDYTVAQARAKAQWLADGVHVETRPIKLRRTMRIVAVLKEYFSEHRPEHSDWFKTVRTLFNRYVVPKFGDQWLSGVSKDEWLTLIETAALDQRSRGVNLHKALRSFLSWAVERGLLKMNPLLRTKLDLPLLPDLAKRPAPTLSVEQLCQIYEAAQSMGAPWFTIIGLLILTGEPIDNVRGIKDSDIDWVQGIWTVERKIAPGLDSAAIRTLPLPSEALVLVEPYRGRSGYYFQSSTTSRPINFYSEIIERLRSKSRVIGEWGVRDIRRAVRWNMETGPDAVPSWTKAFAVALDKRNPLNEVTL